MALLRLILSSSLFAACASAQITSIAVTEYGLTEVNVGGRDYQVGSYGGLTHATVDFNVNGTETRYALSLNNATRTSDNSTYSQQVYRAGDTFSYTVRRTYALTDSNTLKIDIQITNNDTTYTIVRAHFLEMLLRLSEAPSEETGGISVSRFGTRVGGFLSNSAVSVGWWPSTWEHSTQLSSTTYNSAQQTDFTISLEMGGERSHIDSPYRVAIAPGQSLTYTWYFRFNPAGTSKLATLPYDQFRAERPMVLDWPDRRPIATDFLASGALNHKGAANWRTWFNDSTVDDTDHVAFRTRLMERVNANIARLNGMAIRPQGIIVWDLEGQEFPHTMTYVGAPNLLAHMAPEMEAVADEMFAAYRNAGYRVGLTLRPQTFTAGPDLPSTCVYNADGDQMQWHVMASGNGARSLYVCTATDTWTASGGGANQRDLMSYSLALDELRLKVRYSMRRWGITLFYVDTTIFDASNGVYDYRVWQSLYSEFPNVLFIPEWENEMSFAYSAPFESTQASWSTPGFRKEVYPDAFSTFFWQNESPTESQTAAAIRGIQSGDQWTFQGWHSAWNLTETLAMYSAAALNVSSLIITDTDSGTTRSFSANPRTAGPYPLVLRVAFSSSSTFSGAETTYCEARSTVRCWQAGTEVGAATLDLTGLTHRRSEYRTYSGRLYSAGLAAGL